LENSPTALNGILESGDELLAINNERVSGRDKMEVSQMIRTSGVSLIILLNDVKLNYFYNI
jgi:hypothetical protein